MAEERKEFTNQYGKISTDAIPPYIPPYLKTLFHSKRGCSGSILLTSREWLICNRLTNSEEDMCVLDKPLDKEVYPAFLNGYCKDNRTISDES